MHNPDGSCIADPCPEHGDVWPEPSQPCSDDADCGQTCYLDGGQWVYEGTRANAYGGGGEDVQYFCSCEHHDAKDPA